MLTGILHRIYASDKLSTTKPTRLFWISCIGFYCLYLLSLVYTTNTNETFRHLQLKSSLVFVPLMLVLYPPKPEKQRQYTTIYLILLAIAAAYCLVYAAVTTLFGKADNSVWFYHSLVSPYKQHAVLFSLLIFFALTEHVRRLSRKEYLGGIIIHWLMLILLMIFLLLLSSKLIITGFVLFVFVFITRMTRNRRLTIIAIAALLSVVIAVFATGNPISRRFKEIAEGDMALISQQKFNQGTYFNGLQFRLLQWRNVSELLNENHAWLMGLSPGNAQEKLNEKYIAKDMYSGTIDRGERGFLGYNTHNQFLESTLHLGIVGLVLFLLAICGLIKLCLNSDSIQLWVIVGILLAFCCTESVLETQFGLVVFTFFPLFFYYGAVRDKPYRKT